MSAESECLACCTCCISMQESVGWQEMARISILVLSTWGTYWFLVEVCFLKWFHVETLFYNSFFQLLLQTKASSSQHGISDCSDDPWHWVSPTSECLKEIGVVNLGKTISNVLWVGARSVVLHRNILNVSAAVSLRKAWCFMGNCCNRWLSSINTSRGVFPSLLC